MRKILLDKVREDFSHTHPEFNTLQSKPHTGGSHSNTSPNTNNTSTNNQSCINTLVNPFTLPSPLMTSATTTDRVHHTSPMTQSSIHVFPYNSLQNSVPVITNQSIVFPPPLLQGSNTQVIPQPQQPQATLSSAPTTNQQSYESNNRLNSSSSSTTSSGDDDEEMELNIHDASSSHVTTTATTTTSPEKKRKSTRRTSNTRRRSHSNQSNHSNEPATSATAQDTNSAHQTMCCIQNCTKDVSNRLRFSLRCETEFKPDYVAKFWNNICNYCYFHDLYQWKKLNQQSDSNNSSASTTTTKRKNSTSSNGRKRANSSLSTNSTTSNRSSKSVKSDLSDQIANHHPQDHHQHLSPPPSITNSTTQPTIATNHPSATISSAAATTASHPTPTNMSTNLKKVNEVKKPLKIDTSFTLSTSLHKSNVPTNPPVVVVNSYVDPSPVHKEDVNALLDFLSAASQNN